MRLRPAAITAAATLASLSLAPAAAEARKPPTVPPLAGVTAAPPLAPDAIPASIGHQGRAAFRVSLAGVPAGVDPARFAELAARSGARWGLRFLGETTRQPLVSDRVNTVGFTAATDPGALGVQRDVVQSRRSRATGRLVREKILDQDLALAVDVAWQQGPDHPSALQFDLETVLIHELGHLAGNKEHAPLCSNTPLVPSAAPGEWWRSTEDYSWTGCGGSFRAQAEAHSHHGGAHGHGAPIEHRVVRVTR
ncbi:MAG TPA: hypothetical protein VIL49_17095 [Capillimicrobium sp.]|jgi:hypothetical protein